MRKQEQIVPPPTVADLSSDNPRAIQVEFISGFVSFAKKINTLGILAEGKNLLSALDMRATETIRKAAVGKNDHRILAVVSRELVAAEACYHKSCYRNYTRTIPFSVDKKEDEYIENSRAELQGYEKLYMFNYNRTDLLRNSRI